MTLFCLLFYNILLMIYQVGVPFLFASMKKEQKDSIGFLHGKMTLKIRIALLLTLKIKKNQRPKFFIRTLFIPEFSQAQLFEWGHTILDNIDPN